MNDKCKHIIACASISLSTSSFCMWGIGYVFAICVVVAIVVCVCVGLSKEFYDCVKTKPTGFDKMDLVADVFGAAIGVILFAIIYLI